jgi:pyruvate,water dikinase
VRLVDGRVDPATALPLIDAALGDEGEEIEWAIQSRVVQLSEMAAADTAVHDWLRAGDYSEWEEQPGHDKWFGELRAFLSHYGHRTLQEGEVRHPRWADDPATLLALLAQLVNGAISPPVRRTGAPQPLLDASEPNRRKEVQQLLQRVVALRRLQSRALHAFAYILAGARRWALAAARDAMADGRLLAADDVFFFEPEEMKEMMTGEWNISSRSEIQATARQRKIEYAGWQQTQAPDLLVGETEAQPVGESAPEAFTAGLDPIFPKVLDYAPIR